MLVQGAGLGAKIYGYGKTAAGAIKSKLSSEPADVTSPPDPGAGRGPAAKASPAKAPAASRPAPDVVKAPTDPGGYAHPDTYKAPKPIDVRADVKSPTIGPSSIGEGAAAIGTILLTVLDRFFPAPEPSVSRPKKAGPEQKKYDDYAKFLRGKG